MTVEESPTRTLGPARPIRRRGDRTEAIRTRLGARWPSIARLFGRSVWFVFPLAGMIWVASSYGERWYHGDEWLMIDRTVASSGWWSGAFAGTHGHLMAGNYLVYYLQRIWFGVEGHELVALGFCLSLAAMQISIAAVLHRLGLHTLLAVLAATLVTFFGPGAQDMAWEFQANVNFTFALSFAAAFIALGERKSLRGAIAIAALLVAAVAADSGTAAFGAAYIGVLIVFLWPRRLAAVALGAPLIAHIAWVVFGDGGKYLAPPFSAMWSFGVRVLTLSAGGLVGGGETKAAVARAVGAHPSPEPTIPLSGQTVGFIVLAAATICVAIGLTRHRLDRKLATNLAAGWVGAFVTVAVLARTRSFLFTRDLVPVAGSRFVQWVAVFLLVGFAPAIAAALRPEGRRVRQYGLSVAAIALIVVFVLNLGQMRPVRHFEESWGQGVKSAVQQTVSVVAKGCSDGREPDPSAMPTKQSPEITVGLLQDLLASDDLSRDFGIPATPEVREAVCKPAAQG